MTSAAAGVSRQKKQNQLISVSDKGEGVKKSGMFADVIYGSPKLNCNCSFTVRTEIG